MCRKHLSSPRCRSELIDSAWVVIVPGQKCIKKNVDYVYNSEREDMSSDSETEHEAFEDTIPNTNPLNEGLYILYKYTDRKYYVGYIIETLPDKRAVKFARKYGAPESRSYIQMAGR